MKHFRQLYWLCFHLVFLVVFLFGGFFQFILGFSNTILTFFIVVFLLAVYSCYAILVQKLVFSKILAWGLLFSLAIIVTGIFRGTSVLLIAIYLVFPLLPIAVYLFFYINYKERILTNGNIFRLFYYIAILQLPILVIQKNFYEYLIPFNNSGQTIEWFDFMFGTFFIKSDHSLGVFLLLVIALILTKNTSTTKVVRLRFPSIVYLSITLLLTESNISKLFLFLLLTITVVIPFYKKYRKRKRFKIAAVLLTSAVILFGYSQRDKKYIQDRLGGEFKRQFSLESAERFYELGTAKRFQVIIVAAKKLETKWVGDAPYSYFDIRTGKFKQTRHFSQLIWSYYDLGLVGLGIVLFYMIAILGYLEIGRGWPYILFAGIFMAYSFYTTVLSDIAIFLTMFGCFNKRQST